MKQIPFSENGSRFPIPGSGHGDSSSPRNMRFQKGFRMDLQMMMKDKRLDSFKTCSGKLGQQLSNLRGKPHECRTGDSIKQNLLIETSPVGISFGALQEPKLDSLRVRWKGEFMNAIAIRN